jgi:hypothetical protein
VIDFLPGDNAFQCKTKAQSSREVAEFFQEKNFDEYSEESAIKALDQASECVKNWMANVWRYDRFRTKAF